MPSMIASEGLGHERWKPMESLYFQEIDMGDAFALPQVLARPG
jgi:hypothetical protein